MNIRELAKAKSHHEFENKLRDMLTDKTERESFYNKLKLEEVDENKDLFRDYFEEYAAERKSNKQDYTPDEVAELLAFFSDVPDTTAVYDGAAGTGALLIAKWATLGNEATYYATEFADNAIPYLIHNMAFRNMRAIVSHGDTITQEFKAIYALTPTQEGYSEIQIERLSNDRESQEG